MIEMNTPKVVGCLICGFRSENVIEIEDFQDNGCPDCKRLRKPTTKLDSTCQQCGDDNDLFTAFTAHKVCWNCCKKNQEKATK